MKSRHILGPTSFQRTHINGWHFTRKQQLHITTSSMLHIMRLKNHQRQPTSWQQCLYKTNITEELISFIVSIARPYCISSWKPMPHRKKPTFSLMITLRHVYYILEADTKDVMFTTTSYWQRLCLCRFIRRLPDYNHCGILKLILSEDRNWNKEYI